MYICLPHLSIMLFVGHFLHFCEVSEGMVCVCQCHLVYLSDHSPSLRNLDVNHTVSMTGITTILVKLLKII